MKLKDLSKKRKKQLLIALIAVLVISAVGAAVYARYIRSTNEDKSDFSPAHSIPLTINEDFSNNVKQKVSISVGDTDYPVYVRAAIIFNWKQEGDKGLLYFKKPVSDIDYKLEWNAAKWEFSDPDNGGDGYYYYKHPVSSGGTTDYLINKCEQLNAFTDELGNEYTLNVEIIAQTVQAVGHTDDDTLMAVEDAWGRKPGQMNESSDNESNAESGSDSD